MWLVSVSWNNPFLPRLPLSSRVSQQQLENQGIIQAPSHRTHLMNDSWILPWLPTRGAAAGVLVLTSLWPTPSFLIASSVHTPVLPTPDSRFITLESSLGSSIRAALTDLCWLQSPWTESKFFTWNLKAIQNLDPLVSLAPFSVVSQRPLLVFKSQICYALSKFKNILPLPLQEVLSQQGYHLILILPPRQQSTQLTWNPELSLWSYKEHSGGPWGTEAGNHAAICWWWVEILFEVL